MPDRVARPLGAAADAAGLAEALRPIVDEPASPGGVVALPGTPLLQPTDERRRTGSHYTPRALTEPVVRHALEPAFARIGDDARPEAVLALKLCDPTCGSGAFLVEGCRQLGERLVKAWARHPDTRPRVAPDEDEQLHARRLVATHCIYGVDRNPLAADLAKLSLWLATLARDHEFTFLDHAVKSGDSLVGLDVRQIASAHWDPSEPGLPLFRRLVKERVGEATRGRVELQDAASEFERVLLEPQLRSLEKRLAPVRAMGDAVVAAFFSAEKPKPRARARAEAESWFAAGLQPDWARLESLAATLQDGEHALRPFHWALEFPEVFAAGGFDAIVGNPPFAGKNTFIAGNRANYLPWLQTVHAGAHGNADLVAHFFRRAFGLLRPGGSLGLIATNTVGQGDTRDTGLAALLEGGGAIRRATRRMRWPGEAAVVVSIVHVSKGAAPSPVLDGRQVRRISAYLVEGDLDRSPARLTSNARKAFQGSVVLGMGFTFDDTAAAKGESESIETMRALIASSQKNAERIRPYIGSEEVNSSPTHSHNRYVIDFADFPLRRETSLPLWTQSTIEQQTALLRTSLVPVDYPDPVAADWPDLLEIVERRVKPERIRKKREARAERWWRFGDRQSGLYNAIRNLDYVLVTGAAAVMHHMFASVPSNSVFSHKLVVICTAHPTDFAVLQSTIHEIWSRSFGTTYGSVDALTYNPTQVFQTFPFPTGCDSDQKLESAGVAYHRVRSAILLTQDEGLTKTYNRFHERLDIAPDIASLREGHSRMDAAVLRAYGWEDLVADAQADFIDVDVEEGKRAKTRLEWPASVKDEVLARLLRLNAERHAEEVRLGLAPFAATTDMDKEAEREAAE